MVLEIGGDEEEEGRAMGGSHGESGCVSTLSHDLLRKHSWWASQILCLVYLVRLMSVHLGGHAVGLVKGRRGRRRCDVTLPSMPEAHVRVPRELMAGSSSKEKEAHV